MPFNLKGRHFLSMKDNTPEEIDFLLQLSIKLKQDKYAGLRGSNLAGKNIALIFEKPSTRTRCAFVVACVDEGAHPEYLGKDDIQLGKKETVKDTARVLGRMFDGIQFRGFKQEMVEALARHSGVPVYNGLTDLYHPTQILADLMTVQEACGALKGVKLCFVGDGRNNVARSLLIGCSKMGVDYTVVAPRSLQPEEETVKQCREWARGSDCTLSFTDQVGEGVKGADVVYTDVWVSMGEEAKSKERVQLLKPYQVNEALMAQTGKRETIFLHCLPAVKGNEVSVGVIEGPSSRVWDEAENRKHTIKAIMLATI